MIKDKSIFIKNIYYMLSYAFTTLNQGGYEDVATEEFENIHNLFAAILAKGIGKQLKQGLYREYLNRKDDITVVRGKIDMPGTIRNRLSRKQVLTCEYDELSENNLFNQILKTTVMLLGSGEINHIGPGEKSQYRPDENRQSRVASPQTVLFTRPVVGQPVSW